MTLSPIAKIQSSLSTFPDLIYIKTGKHGDSNLQQPYRYIHKSLEIVIHFERKGRNINKENKNDLIRWITKKNN